MKKSDGCESGCETVGGAQAAAAGLKQAGHRSLGCGLATCWILADFGRDSVIFGQKWAVFIFFDKEEEVRFLSGFFILGLWLAAHELKWVSEASEQVEAVNLIRPDFCTCFTIQTHLFAL